MTLTTQTQTAHWRVEMDVPQLRMGKDIIVPGLRKHGGQMRRVFSEHSPEELRGLEVTLKKIGKRAAALME